MVAADCWVHDYYVTCAAYRETCVVFFLFTVQPIMLVLTLTYLTTRQRFLSRFKAYKTLIVNRNSRVDQYRWHAATMTGTARNRLLVLFDFGPFQLNGRRGYIHLYSPYMVERNKQTYIYK